VSNLWSGRGTHLEVEGAVDAILLGPEDGRQVLGHLACSLFFVFVAEDSFCKEMRAIKNPSPHNHAIVLQTVGASAVSKHLTACDAVLSTPARRYERDERRRARKGRRIIIFLEDFFLRFGDEKMEVGQNSHLLVACKKNFRFICSRPQHTKQASPLL
jgi:hypothetical protein